MAERTCEKCIHAGRVAQACACMHICPYAYMKLPVVCRHLGLGSYGKRIEECRVCEHHEERDDTSLIMGIAEDGTSVPVEMVERDPFG